jgi:general nucleoside transport system ATP-binding protein
MQLAMRNITKSFGHTLANDNISLDLAAGEVHALLGENGAGKSTLMKILAGLIRADTGDMAVAGRTVEIRSPRDAIKAGIAIVSQHPLIASRLAVFENLIAGVPPDQRWRRNKRAARKQFESLFQSCNFDVNLDQAAGDLPLSKQKQVEIVRALARDARLLIFDEPTDVFTPLETKQFFLLVKRLALEGRAIVVITHVLEEALEYSSRVTVLKKGRVAGTFRSTETNVAELARLMVGELPAQERNVRHSRPKDRPVLEVSDVRIKASNGQEKVRGVSLKVHPGEIVGLAGVAGNGQEDLIEAIVGLQSISAGTIRVGGRAVDAGDTRALITANRIGYIPPDRTRDGLIGPMSVADNLVTDVIERSPWSRFGLRNMPWLSAWARGLVLKYGVRPASATLAVGMLSGGNQQKVILARVLDRKPNLLVVANPTRGLDIGASQWVWSTLKKLREDEAAILLWSGDVEELRQLADRILVFFRGTVSGELSPHEASSERLGLLMGGAKQANAV